MTTFISWFLIGYIIGILIAILIFFIDFDFWKLGVLIRWSLGSMIIRRKGKP